METLKTAAFTGGILETGLGRGNRIQVAVVGEASPGRHFSILAITGRNRTGPCLSLSSWSLSNPPRPVEFGSARLASAATFSRALIPLSSCATISKLLGIRS